MTRLVSATSQHTQSISEVEFILPHAVFPLDERQHLLHEVHMLCLGWYKRQLYLRQWGRARPSCQFIFDHVGG